MDHRELVKSKRLLYSDSVGSDACGIGGIAATNGRASHEVITTALLALRGMEHRGGICGESGDGAGIVCQIPREFFLEEIYKINPDLRQEINDDSPIVIATVFNSETVSTRNEELRQLIKTTLETSDLLLVGIRNVPVNNDAIPASTRQSCPASIEQWIWIGRPENNNLEEWLYFRKLLLTWEIQTRGLNGYILDISSQLIGYKGLLTSSQFSDFYPDLTHPAFETGICTFHRRYSTNTFPNWTLAQPFRLIGHNGEINTIRTNRNAVHAYSRGLSPALPCDSLITPGKSDSATLDEWLEYLVRSRRWSLLRAMRLAIPPVWDTEADVWGQKQPISLLFAAEPMEVCVRGMGRRDWSAPMGP